MIPMCSRRHEPAINQTVGEELHCCGFCGTRTELDDSKPGGPNWETASICPHCEQTYYLTDEDEELIPLDDDGEIEIEIVDEGTGDVIGMTQASEEGKPAGAIERLEERLGKLRAEQSGELDGVLADIAPAEPLDASLGDLDRLFGVKPSPYGDDFGSFG